MENTTANSLQSEEVGHKEQLDSLNFWVMSSLLIAKTQEIHNSEEFHSKDSLTLRRQRYKFDNL